MLRVVVEPLVQLEKAPINDVLPLKAARRDAIAKLESFGASRRDLVSMVSFTFAMRCHFIPLAP